MPDLDQQLRSYLDVLAKEAIGRAEEHGERADRSEQQRARRWPWVTLAAGAAAAALVIFGFLVTSDDPTGQDVEVGPADTTTPDASTDLPPARGGWRHFPDTVAPGFELSPFAAVVDDGRVLVMYLENGGGDVAGEILDLRDGTAEPIATGPLGWRAHAMVGWTGNEVVVAGGTSGPGIDIAGAAYDPSTDSWRRITEPPGFEPGGLSDNQAFGPAVWTGTELISWQSSLAYNPETDTWRRIAPSPLAPRMDEAIAAVQGGVLVWGGCDIEVRNCDDALEAALTDGALYSPATDSWTVLPESPLGGGAGVLAVATTWDDRAIVVVAHPHDPEAPTVAALDPVTLEWQELAPLPEGAGKRASALVWTGTHAIVWGGYTGDSLTEETDAGFMLNPVLGQWRPLPAGGLARRGHAALWTPHGLLIAGGSTAQPTLFTPTSAEPCPGQHDPRELDELSGDGLPELGATTYANVAGAVLEHAGDIAERYDGVVDVSVGPGWGVAYSIDNGEVVIHRGLSDSIINVHVASPASCKTEPAFSVGADGRSVPIWFVVEPQ
jgi:hypothetical protein